MSRHHSEAATEFNSVQWTMRSRHQREVATGNKQLTEHLCRDISTESETVATSVCKETKVATSSAKEIRSRHHLNGRDIRCTEKKVATRSSCRDINYTERKSRHHSVVVTTLVREEGRDNTWLSRHQLQRKEVATRPSCRDISCRDQRVATTSRGRDINYTKRRSRQDQAIATSVSSKGMSQPSKGFCDKD